MSQSPDPQNATHVLVRMCIRDPWIMQVCTGITRQHHPKCFTLHWHSFQRSPTAPPHLLPTKNTLQQRLFSNKVYDQFKTMLFYATENKRTFNVKHVQQREQRIRRIRTYAMRKGWSRSPRAINFCGPHTTPLGIPVNIVTQPAVTRKPTHKLHTPRTHVVNSSSIRFLYGASTR